MCKKRGADCGAEQLAVNECKVAMERRAQRQLQTNAMVQCPHEFKAYSRCMDEDTQAQPREECRRLWMDMQLCVRPSTLWRTWNPKQGEALASLRLRPCILTSLL